MHHDTDDSGVTRRDFVRRSAAIVTGAIAGTATPLSAMGLASHDAHPGVADETHAARTASDLTLWYRRPAAQWVEALPVGSGRLGAMVFGGVERERLQLNEDTLWSGGPRDWNNPKAPAVLAEVRRTDRQGEVRRSGSCRARHAGSVHAVLRAAGRPSR